MMTVNDILQATGGKLIQGKPYRRVSRFSIDSRTMRKGDIFVAIKGNRYDGHNFIKEAVKKGCRALILSHLPPTTYNLSPIIIRVKDTTKALGDIAHYIRTQSQARVIAVTGSNGKTTTKEMINAILKRHFSGVLCSRGNENNAIGLPLTLLRLKNEKVCVLEMGMNRFGEIDHLTRIARPHIGVITNIGPVHLEGLGGIGQVAKAKLELLQYLNESNTLVINGDDRHLAEVKNAPSPIVTFGIGAHNDFRATDINYKDGGWEFYVNDLCGIRLNLLGRHNIYNALAAVAVARLSGVDYGVIAAALSDVTLPHSRLEPTVVSGVHIIDDTYNSNPISFQSAVEALKHFPSTGKKIVLCGDMLELGERSDFFHTSIAETVVAAHVDILVTVGKHSRRTHRAARQRGMRKEQLWHFETPDEAGRHLRKIAKRGDIVLIKGSRGTKMEKVIACYTTSCIP